MARASNSSDRTRPLILVADDSSTMRMSVSMSLEMSGYEVICAEDGSKALQLLRDGLRPDLVLTDILMPNMTGLELIREARRLLRFTPIVALTTQSHDHMRDEGRQAGATAWLLKPTGGSELVALVARFLAPAPPTH